MKKSCTVIILLAILGITGLVRVPSVSAEEAKMVGVITQIKIAEDGKSATAILKDVNSGESVSIIVADDLTLDKFKDKRIVEGDEIRCKFDKQEGKNSSRIFRKTAGC